MSATGISSHKLANRTAYARVWRDAHSSGSNGKSDRKIIQDVDESYEVNVPVTVQRTLSVSGFGGLGVCLSCRGNRRGDGLSVSRLVTAPAAILLLAQPTVPLAESRSHVT